MTTSRQRAAGILPADHNIHAVAWDSRRKAICVQISDDRARLLAFNDTISDDEKLRQLCIGLGQLACIAKQPVPAVLLNLAAHCVGWIESKGTGVNVFSFINHERKRQRQLFLDGVHPFDVSNPGVDELLKLRVIGEEVGEVAKAVDKLSLAAGKHPIHKRTLELCAELVQVAAVAVAWLEALEGR